MQRLLSLFTLVAMGGGVWMFLSGGGLDQLAVDPNGQAATHPAGTSAPIAWNGGGMPTVGVQPTATLMPPVIGAAAPPASEKFIRIASYNIRDFGPKKLGDYRVVMTLAEIVRQFDVVAIQEISNVDQRHMEDFVRIVNSTGRQFEFVVSPRLGNTNQKEQYAFVFDVAKVMIDRSSVYVVGDPENLLHREPYVATFATRVQPASDAFTFTLVNVHTDPTPAVLPQELEILAEVYRAVRRAGGNEDDVIMLGDFNASDQKMAQTRIGKIPDLKPLLGGSNVFTNTRQNQLYDNLLIHAPSTTEYLGRSGVFDITKAFNLSQSEAETVSDHFPVWAEFNAYETDNNGRIASRAGVAR